ncbi:extracellular solute-binding protein [Streptomyces sp. B6B3]|uniref:ABC transporter substrate-binding protein n=1 Tax=Streptomyces sp. B6B3 TaxID=3153570 RepID=UPI00325C4AEE
MSLYSVDVLYGVPTGGNAIGLILNPAVFDAAGVELPDPDTWTWSEFVDVANAITANSPDGTYGFDPRANDLLGVYAGQRGTPIFDEEGELGVAASTIEDFFELEPALLDGGGPPPAEIIQEGATLTPEQSLLGTGEAAMTITYSNLVGAYAAAAGEDLRLVALPGETEYQQPGATVLPS